MAHDECTAILLELGRLKVEIKFTAACFLEKSLMRSFRRKV